MNDDFDPLNELRDLLKVDRNESQSTEALLALLVKNTQDIKTLRLKSMLHLVEKETETVLKSVHLSYISHMTNNKGLNLKLHELSFIEINDIDWVIEKFPESLIIHCPYDIHAVYNKTIPFCSSEEELKAIIKDKIVANLAHDINYIEEQNQKISETVAIRGRAA